MLSEVVAWFQSAAAAQALLVPVLSAAVLGMYELLKRHCAVSPDEWRAQAQQFNKLSGDIYALWTRRNGSPRVEWSVYSRKPRSARDVDMFLAEAHSSGQMMMRSAWYVLGPSYWVRRSAEDRWLDVLKVATAAQSDVTMRGRGPGYTSDGGVIEDLATAGVVACTQLAAGKRPALSGNVFRLLWFTIRERRALSTHGLANKPLG